MTAPRTGVFARVFPAAPPPAIAAAVRDAGYQTVQMNLRAFSLPTIPRGEEWDQIDPAQIRAAFTDVGIGVWGLSATYNMAHPDPRVRSGATEAARALVARAAEFGAGVVTICTGSRNPDDMWAPHGDNGSAAAWRDFRVSFDALLEEASNGGVRLGVEPETGNVVSDAVAARRLLDELGADADLVCIVLDPANLVKGVDLPQREVLTQAFGSLAGSVGCLHAKDLVPWSQTLRGRGVVDLELVAALHQVWTPSAPVIVQDVLPDEASAARQYLESLWD